MIAECICMVCIQEMRKDNDPRNYSSGHLISLYLYVDEVNKYLSLGSKLCIPIELFVFEKKTYIFLRIPFSLMIF